MSQANRIILWQLWRLTRDEMAVAVVTQYFFLGLLLLVAYTHMNAMFHLLMPVFFVMAFFMAVPAVALASLRAGETNPRYPMPFPLHLDFAQPVRTFTLVFLTMAYSCVKAATVYLAVALPLHFGLGETMPLLPYVYWLMVMAAVLQAFLWIPASTGGRGWGYVLGVGGVSLLFLREVFVGPGGTDNLLESAEPLRGLFNFTPVGYLGLGLLAVGAFLVAVAGVERQRHGEALLPRLRSRSRAAAPKTSARRSISPFNGPIRAQMWCETRRALLTPLLFPLLAVASMILVSVLALPIPDKVELDLMAVLWVLVVAGSFITCCFLAGHLTAALRFRGGTWSYSTFEATLPMGTGRLTLIKMGTVLASGVLAAGLLTAGTAIALLPHLGQKQWADGLNELLQGASGLWGGISPLQRFALVYFSVLWALSIPPLLFSFGEAGVAYPRQFNAIVGLCVVDVLLVALLLVVGYPLHLYGLVHVWALPTLTIGATIWAVYRVLERGYLDKRLFMAWAVVWGISVGIWCVLASQLPPQLGLQLVLLFLPLLAVASPSLTLAANRHR